MRFAILCEHLARELIPPLTALGHSAFHANTVDTIDSEATSDVIVLPAAPHRDEISAFLTTLSARGDMWRTVVLQDRDVSWHPLAEHPEVVRHAQVRTLPGEAELDSSSHQHLVRATLRAAAALAMPPSETRRLHKYREAAISTYSTISAELSPYDVVVDNDITVPVLASVRPGAQRLTFMFSGAIDPVRAAGRPVFQRSSWRDEIEGSVVYLADPTLTIHSSLRIGWAQGAHGTPAIAPLVGTVDGFIQAALAANPQLEIRAYGSSAGGFISLMVGSYSMHPLHCIANNPQIDWLRYDVRSAVAEVITKAYPGEAQEGFRDRHHAAVSIPEVWRLTRFIPHGEILINSASSSDMKDQILPLLERLPAHTGNDSLDSLTISFYSDRRSGHNPLSKSATLHKINSPDTRWQPLTDGNCEPESSAPSSPVPKETLHVAPDTSLPTAPRAVRRGISFGGHPTRFSSLADFLNRSGDVSGNIEIMHGLPIHLHWTNRGARKTFVTFSGAVTNAVKNVPAYSGYGITRELETNILLISDPTLLLSRDLHLAWYAGSSHQPQLQHDVTSIIESLAGGDELILFGPSGGGFAALEQATRLPNSIVVASNPQTSILRYNQDAVLSYLRTAWGQNIPPTTEDLPFSSEVVTRYSAPTTARVIYIQNTGDVDHIERHQKPFLQNIHADNTCLVLSPALGAGHVGPDKESFKSILSAVADSSSWTDIATRLEHIPITRKPQSTSNVPTNAAPQASATPDRRALFIYGGCVSRDMASLGSDDYQILKYVARQSWISAANPPTPLPDRPSSLTSAFQQRSLEADFNSSAYSDLRENAGQIDILLMDMLNERSGVYRVGPGFVTNTWELSMSGWREDAPGWELIEFGSDEHLRLWKSAAAKLRDLLEELGILSRSFVLETRFATRSAQGDDLTSRGKPLPPEEMNRRFQKYYDELPDLGFNVIRVPDELIIADRDHLWGLEPYHYTKPFYEHFLHALTEASGSLKAPVE